MNTQLTTENLSVILHNNIPVITTELLAQLYGTDIANVQMNFSRNTERFIEGKHYFKLQTSELKNLRLTYSWLQISAKTRSLILWTERGAARHAKMLETDQAWEVFEKLEDCYFSQRKPALTIEEPINQPITVKIPRTGRWLVAYSHIDGQVQIVNIDGSNCVDADAFRQLKSDAYYATKILNGLIERLGITDGSCNKSTFSQPLRLSIK